MHDRPFAGIFAGSPTLNLTSSGKILVISDFHMGGGGRGDDLAHNGPLIEAILERHYLAGGWTLVLNGDIEELWRFSLTAIRKTWPGMYVLFDRFAAEGRLYKILGNHDESLSFEKNYPYPLYNAIKIESRYSPIFVYHGHQSSKMYTDYNDIARVLIRYFFKPLGVHNISSARGPHRRFFVEKKAYAFSLENECISIIGHTHRPLFESLGRFEFIKFEIERLCRDYPVSSGEDRRRIYDEVNALRMELSKLRRSERRDILRESLYGDELPVPCLFNSGSSISRRGLTALELDGENISLVYWFADGEGRKFINRGRYTIERLRETRYRRSVLNTDRLDYVQARIDLLGKIYE
jgi:UDP-2,3-diacylglucosamine pyrophosphatase LpxH